MSRDRKFESKVRSGFRAWNGELEGSGLLGSEGDNSPFRVLDQDKLYIRLPAPGTPLPTCFGTHGYFGAELSSRSGFRPEQQPRPGVNTVRFGNSTKKYPGYQDMCGVGFRVRGTRIRG